MPEYSSEFLVERLTRILTENLTGFQYQKVSGANILFFGFGDGTTGQFEYVDDETWKLSMSKGVIE